MTSTNCWVPVPDNSDFGIHNLPFGIFSVGNNQKRVGVAIGNSIIDLAVLADLGFFDHLDINKLIFHEETLNDFIALGKAKTGKVRQQLQHFLVDEKSPLKEHEYILVDQQDATMHLPLEIGNYTDFYSSLEHATNVGKMFRDPDNALLPNWKHIPVAYHGRASSIVESGVPIHRPSGQVMPAGASAPIFTASKRMDFELEMAFVIGKENRLGKSIPITKAEEYIFGMVLFNDWSARDLQKWEYVPLGPFLGKNFGSSISPWIVTMEALEPFRTKGPLQDPPVLPYLQSETAANFDIELEVLLQPDGGNENTISQSNFKYMYWSMAQQLAHHTVNGCNVQIGDLLASGTISGPVPSSYGSMLELTWGGTKPLQLEDGTTRSFVEDYDTITMKGVAINKDVRVGFGEVQTKILPTLHD